MFTKAAQKTAPGVWPVPCRGPGPSAAVCASPAGGFYLSEPSSLPADPPAPLWSPVRPCYPLLPPENKQTTTQRETSQIYGFYVPHMTWTCCSSIYIFPCPHLRKTHLPTQQFISKCINMWLLPQNIQWFSKLQAYDQSVCTKINWESI